jgi:hypothetical protein
MDVKRTKSGLRVMKRPMEGGEGGEGEGEGGEWVFREYPSGRQLEFAELFTGKYKDRLWLILRNSITPYQLAVLIAAGEKELGHNGVVTEWARRHHVWRDMVARDFIAAWLMYAQQSQTEDQGGGGGAAVEGMRLGYVQWLESMSEKRKRPHTLWKRCYELLTLIRRQSKALYPDDAYYFRSFPGVYHALEYDWQTLRIRCIVVKQPGAALGAEDALKVITLTNSREQFWETQMEHILRNWEMPWAKLYYCPPSIDYRAAYRCAFNRDIVCFVIPVDANCMFRVERVVDRIVVESKAQPLDKTMLDDRKTAANLGTMVYSSADGRWMYMMRVLPFPVVTGFEVACHLMDQKRKLVSEMVAGESIKMLCLYCVPLCALHRFAWG